MDDQGFDRVVRGVRALGSRRRLLGLGAALPLAGLMAALREEGGEARRRHGRNRGNRPGRRKDQRKGQRGGGNKPGPNKPCLPPTANLQVAVNGAKPGDTLTLCAGTFPEQNLTITRNLTVVGAGSSKTLLTESSSLGSVLSVSSGATVTIQGLTLTGWGSRSAKLAAVVNAGTLTLDDVVVTKSRDHGAVTNEGRLLLTNGSVITRNTATFTEPGASGISNLGGSVVIASGCQVTLNDANQIAGAGGIYSDVASSIELEDSSIVVENMPANCYADDGTIGNCDG